MVALALRALTALLSAFLLVGCQSCEPTKPEPAGRRELELVEQALRGGGAYRLALAELEKTPDDALRAVREQSAPPRSRKAVFLAMMADHLEHLDSHREWKRRLDASPRVAGRFGELGKTLGAGGGQVGMGILGPEYPEHIAGLDSANQVQFWAERLLALGGDTEQQAAVPHLRRIGNAAAIDALALYVRTPGSNLATADAAKALAELGRARDLAEALAAYVHPDIPPSAIPANVAALKAGLGALPAKARPESARELLDALEKERLSADQRRGYLAAVGAFGDDAAVERLVALRKTPWGRELKADIDAASAAILDREPDPVRKGGKP